MSLETIKTALEEIRDETQAYLNTASRVGTPLVDTIDIVSPMKTKTDNLTVTNPVNLDNVELAMLSGDTASRPTTNLFMGRRYFDTDLKRPIWYNGSAWSDLSVEAFPLPKNYILVGNSSGVPEAKYRFKLFDNDVNASDFTASWGTEYTEIDNSSNSVVVTLPSATADTVGEEIVLWLKDNPLFYNVKVTTGDLSDSINEVSSSGSDHPVAIISDNLSEYTMVTIKCVGENDIRMNFVSSVSVPAGGSGIATASIWTGGSAVGVTDGDYTATQSNTSGSGSGATFTVTVASNVITAIVSIDSAGDDYLVNDLVDISVASDGTWFLDPVLNVDSLV